MTKIQKIWLGISAAMFVVPEVLFSFLFSSVAQLFGKTFPSLLYIPNQQFFTDHPTYLFFALFVELLGVLFLLILNLRNKKGKFLSVLLFIILLWLAVVFYIGYAIAFRMSFP